MDTVVVHNAEDAKQYLLLGFAVLMPLRVASKLSWVGGTTVECRNEFGGHEPMVTAWLSTSKATTWWLSTT